MIGRRRTTRGRMLPLSHSLWVFVSVRECVIECLLHVCVCMLSYPAGTSLRTTCAHKQECKGFPSPVLPSTAASAAALLLQPTTIPLKVVRCHFALTYLCGMLCDRIFIVAIVSLPTHIHTQRQSRAEHTDTHIVTLHVRFVPFLSLGFSSLDNALHGSLSPSFLPAPPLLLCACHIPCLCGGNKSSCGQRRDADVDANCAVRTISNSASCSLSLCAPFA